MADFTFCSKLRSYITFNRMHTYKVPNSKTKIVARTCVNCHVSFQQAQLLKSLVAVWKGAPVDVTSVRRMRTGCRHRNFVMICWRRCAQLWSRWNSSYGDFVIAVILQHLKRKANPCTVHVHDCTSCDTISYVWDTPGTIWPLMCFNAHYSLD